MQRFMLLLLLIAGTAQAQQDAWFLSLHFDNDQFVLTEAHLESLDSLWREIGAQPYERILIKGHTDSVASLDYNQALSERRAASIWAYLRTRGVAESMIEIDAKGETSPISPNSDEDGRASNRRVEMIVFQPSVPMLAEVEPDTLVEPEPIVASPRPQPQPQRPQRQVTVIEVEDCNKDTTLQLNGGGWVRVNYCDYLDQKDCLDMAVYNTPQLIEEAGLSTLTHDGQQLASGGMLKFSDCEENPWRKPVRLLMPIPSGSRCNVLEGLTLWRPGPEGSWQEVPGFGQARVVSVNRNLFYSIDVPADSLRSWGGMCNLDQLLQQVEGEGIVATAEGGRQREACVECNSPQVKIVGTDGVELLDVRISLDCPMTTFNLQEIRNGVFAGGIPCQRKSTMLLSGQAVTANGDTTLIRMKVLNSFDYKRLFGGCLRGAGVHFASNNKVFFRKYVIRPEDLVGQESELAMGE